MNSLSQRGKLHIFISKWTDEFESLNAGRFVSCLRKQEAEYYHYDLEIDLYNSSSNTLIMRSIEIGYFKDRKLIFRNKPNDKETRRMSGPIPLYDSMGSINIPAKSVISIKLLGGLDSSDEWFSNIWVANTLCLMYLDSKNGSPRSIGEKTLRKPMS